MQTTSSPPSTNWSTKRPSTGTGLATSSTAEASSSGRPALQSATELSTTPSLPKLTSPTLPAFTLLCLGLQSKPRAFFSLLSDPRIPSSSSSQRSSTELLRKRFHLKIIASQLARLKSSKRERYYSDIVRLSTAPSKDGCCRDGKERRFLRDYRLKINCSS